MSENSELETYCSTTQTWAANIKIITAERSLELHCVYWGKRHGSQATLPVTPAGCLSLHLTYFTCHYINYVLRCLKQILSTSNCCCSVYSVFNLLEKLIQSRTGVDFSLNYMRHWNMKFCANAKKEFWINLVILLLLVY